MDVLVIFIPLFPFIAAIIIGFGYFSSQVMGLRGELSSSDVARNAIYLSSVSAVLLLIADLVGENSGSKWWVNGWIVATSW